MERKNRSVSKTGWAGKLQQTFTDWPDVLKRLEDRFINVERPIHRSFNWPEKSKFSIFTRTAIRKEISHEIRRLDPEGDDWAVFFLGDYFTAKHIVFECKANVIDAILAINRGDLFIGDKKSTWFVHFKHMVDEIVSLIKSSGSAIPFG